MGIFLLSNCNMVRLQMQGIAVYPPGPPPSELHTQAGIEPLIKGVADLLHTGDVVGQGIGAGRRGAACHDHLQILRTVPQKFGQSLVTEHAHGHRVQLHEATHMYVRVCAYVCECESYKSPKYKDVFKKDQELFK